MKNVVKIALCAAAISVSSISFAQAQQKQDTSSVGQDLKEAADTVANKTAKTAAKGVAAIKDKIYKDKTGPQGQTVYIDKHSKYYYINEKGHKVHVAKDKLKDNPRR